MQANPCNRLKEYVIKRPQLLIVTVALLAIFTSATTLAANTEKSKLAPSQVKRAKPCPNVIEGIEFYKQSTWKWQTLRGVPKTPTSKRQIAIHACAYARSVAKLWQTRSYKARVNYEAWRKEWNWQTFPQWIIDLARCETSINWYAEGSSSHGTFYSAFNIGRTRYDIAAHKMGVRGWHEGKGVPSPYEQAMAVIGYVRVYGDGFTGRCHGIARSSW